MTDATPAVWCEQDGCPIAEDGRCFENFPDGEGCPHRRLSADPTDPDARGQSSDEGADLEAESRLEQQPEETASDNDSDHIDLGGDQSLSLSEAGAVAAAYGARVVLVAGEHKAGKTTLVAEFYARFLEGAYQEWEFAGAETLIALDRRYHGARVASGLDAPDTGRTEEEDMRLLDLRIRSDQTLMPLLFSDIRGESFDNVAQGAPVSNEISLARRTDRTMILVNGKRINDPFKRAEAISWTRQLIGGLTEPGGLPRDRPLAIVLAKADIVEEAAQAWFLERAEQLRQLALDRGCGPTEIFVTAARPVQEPHVPKGLGPLFSWIVQPGDQAVGIPPPPPRPDRSFWTVASP
jgi:Double-GTPase 2